MFHTGQFLLAGNIHQDLVKFSVHHGCPKSRVWGTKRSGFPQKNTSGNRSHRPQLPTREKSMPNRLKPHFKKVRSRSHNGWASYLLYFITFVTNRKALGSHRAYSPLLAVVVDGFAWFHLIDLRKKEGCCEWLRNLLNPCYSFWLRFVPGRGVGCCQLVCFHTKNQVFVFFSELTRKVEWWLFPKKVLKTSSKKRSLPPPPETKARNRVCCFGGKKEGFLWALCMCISWYVGFEVCDGLAPRYTFLISKKRCSCADLLHPKKNQKSLTSNRGLGSKEHNWFFCEVFRLKNHIFKKFFRP